MNVAEYVLEEVLSNVCFIKKNRDNIVYLSNKLLYIPRIEKQVNFIICLLCFFRSNGSREYE